MSDDPDPPEGPTEGSRWLAAQWPFLRAHLPPAPARVLEIGCGPLGGFVPFLLAAGHDAVGVDPHGPEGAAYRQVEFEDHHPPEPVDVVVACTSLHHVADLDRVIGRVADTLVPGGVVVVIEWARERFDEPTARWGFDRLPEPEAGHQHGQHEHGQHEHEHEQGEGHQHGHGDQDPCAWLRHHQEAWLASGRPWESYLAEWAREEGLHAGEDIVAALDRHLERTGLDRTPYLFADLAGITEAEERQAIDAGLVRATGIRYVGRSRAAP
ncbi:class I SAM-dependent methyltransferase [Nocardioides donggukensis]|uniref:Methyltransferase domain-containing protein n=1 Tax=Nocardioides donggukensis TaxID=2774019 RepID=A0A927K4X5_9ACTN|nr:methyltransferase domain-containing protein [Nocardioides donggukensis]MBD8869033.1 methyltransferase domain-containing protein [Nocardioides donggukensis]